MRSGPNEIRRKSSQIAKLRKTRNRIEEIRNQGTW